MSEMHHDHELENKKKNRPVIERDQQYWLSIEQWQQSPEFMKLAEEEFHSSPLKEGDSEDGVARRDFLKLMGASLALATASCVRRPVQKIVPYNKQPEEVTLGVPNYYTASYFDGTEAYGVLVKTREGRPIKIESNPLHPFNKGGLGVRGQASLLSLYDPERLKAPQHNLQRSGKTNFEAVQSKWEDLDAKVVDQLKKGRVALLTGALTSPSTRAVVGDFAKAFEAKHYVWDSFNFGELREGQRLSYGEALVPHYRFDKAKRIISIDADFLGTWLSPVAFNGQFSEGRKNAEKMSRLISFDSTHSLTAANADIRFKIKPSQQLDVVMGLLHEIVIKKSFGSYSGNSEIKAALEPFANVSSLLKIEGDLWSQIAQDLCQHAGESLVVAGGLATGTVDSVSLQVAVNFLNTVLGNDGKTVDFKNANTGLNTTFADLEDLIEKMNSGQIETLILHKVNPVYSLPAASGFEEAIKKVKMVLYTGDRVDETAVYADYIIPDNHALESWGDLEFARGVYSINQPAISPLYETRGFQLSLMTWAYLADKGSQRLKTLESFYDFLRVVWKEEIYPQFKTEGNFDEFWTATLQKGFAGTMEENSASRGFQVGAFTSIKKKSTSVEGLELALYSTVQLGDGSLSNVSWLHELPDPVTKIVWDNYVMLSMATAERMGLKQSSVVELTVGEQKLELPVHIQPGLHDEVAAVAVGYGRTRVGSVGNGIGQNAFKLMKILKGQCVTAGLPVLIKKLSKKYELACTQGHHSMEGRQIVVEATLKDYLKQQDAHIHKHPIWSIWSGHKYNGYKWGMAVDLNACTGCSACMVACQSENNVPVVGKKYVLEGREMHWIRIDRYYSGNPSDPQTVFQPVMCQHCDNAPCETVCPVLATVHSSEGLNDMVYNRCVGTRYCSNNCPYKVRRFNWFNYANHTEKTLSMALNPSVGVRTRGVMEKCTFCVQRIHDAKTVARNEGRHLKDGDVKSACQTSCPTGAIVFGDLNDKTSQVAKMFTEDKRAYALLEEWHAAPSVRYLTKIRNNDKETADQHGHANKGDHA